MLAELVAWRRTRVGAPSELLEAVDPVCGMTVAVGPDTTSAEHEGTTYWFCGRGCLLEFRDDPDKYLDPAYEPSM